MPISISLLAVLVSDLTAITLLAYAADDLRWLSNL
jgi:hypothetical protein